MINLNDDKFTGGASGPIFNNGVAGIANNITVSIERKKPEDKDNAPDYKLVFTDEAGATANIAYWYITADTEYKTVDQQIEAAGKMFKHLLHAIYGADYQIPQFNSAKEMLDGVMKLIHDASKQGHKFRIFANYGTPRAMKKYIQPRTWVPMIEPMSIPEEETRLTKGNFDNMERLVEDSMVSTGASAGASDDDDDWN